MEPTIYLLPESETNDRALEHLAEVSNEIFEEELNPSDLITRRVSARTSKCGLLFDGFGALRQGGCLLRRGTDGVRARSGREPLSGQHP